MPARPKALPFATRKAVLRAIADGAKNFLIATRFKVSVATANNWAKQAGVVRGSRISDEELDAKMAEWADKTKELIESDPGDVRPASKKSHIIKFGKNAVAPGDIPKSKLATANPLTNMDQYHDALEQHIARTTLEVANAQTPEAQITAMTTAMLLKALHENLNNPPVVTSWNDLEKLVKLLRLTLGMDDKKDSRVEGFDLRILNAKTDKKPRGKMVEATVIPEPEPVPEPEEEEYEEEEQPEQSEDYIDPNDI